MIQQKQVDYAKELDDVLVAVSVLLRDVKAKKSTNEIVADALQGVMNAVAGLDQVGAELAANKQVALQTVGFRVGEIAGVLLG